LFIVLSFIELKQPNVVELCRLGTRINPVNFVIIIIIIIIIIIKDNVYGAVIVTYSHCESSPGSS